jgi:homoserine kinase type II
MALHTVLTPDQLAAAARQFGLPPPDRALPEPRGRSNTSYQLQVGPDRWFLRLVEGMGLAEGKTEADLAFEAEVMSFLHDAHFPVPRLVLAADGRPWTVVAGRPAMLLAFVPGEPVDRAGAGPDRCRRVGEQLGRLHELSAGFTGERDNPYGPERVAGWLTAVAAWPGLDPEARQALPLLQEELAAAGQLPGAPRGLCHGDLFIDNVLWVGDRISYVLDWEMACSAPFAYDLAVAIDAWCFTDRHEPARVRALLDGYRSKRRLDAETVEALPAWARWAALRFAVSRLHATLGPALPPERVVQKDWRRYRDRLTALRSMGAGGYRELLGPGTGLTARR